MILMRNKSTITNSLLFRAIYLGIVLLFSFMFLGCGSVSKETSTLEVSSSSVESASYSSTYTSSVHSMEISVLSNWSELPKPSSSPSLVLYQNNSNPDEVFGVNTPTTIRLPLQVEIKSIQSHLNSQGNTVSMFNINVQGIPGKLIQYKTSSNPQPLYISQIFLDNGSKRYRFYHINTSENIESAKQFLASFYIL